MVRCGRCHLDHSTPADVKACYQSAAKPPEGRTSHKRSKALATGTWRPIGGVAIADPEQPALVYLMNQPTLKALKIGVTATDRIEQHELHGWCLIESWWFVEGYEALDVEELVLDRWRNVFSARPAVSSGLMPQHGYTETIRDTPATRSDAQQFVSERHREYLDRITYDPERFDDFTEFDEYEDVAWTSPSYTWET